MNLKVLLLCLCVTSTIAYDDVTLIEYINSHNYIFFKNLVAQAGLTEILGKTGPYTVFVPTDEAFAKVGQDTLNAYSTSQLQSIIEYHVVDGYILSAMVTSTTNFTTLLGESVSVSSSRGSVQVNGVALVDSGRSDNIVNNGVIQPIDTVLTPPGPYLTGETLAQILILDDNQFKDILLAFMLANMINLLESNDFTVFAPVDSAFAAHQGQMLSPEAPNAQHLYQEVLKYHIVPGSRRAKDLADGTRLFTLHGTPITVTRDGDTIKVNNATLIETDIFASNGFIHAIDHILFPDDIRPARD